MIASEKPKKRVIFYWFVEYGFFFLIASLFITATVLKYLTPFISLTILLLEFSILLLIFSFLFLVYKWVITEYFILDKHVFIKHGTRSKIIPYENIKEVSGYGNLLQHMMGTTNVVIKTKNNKNYYLKGIKDYKKIEDRILSKMN